MFKITVFLLVILFIFFFFSSRRRHTIFKCDWSSDVCSSDLQDQLSDVTELEEFAAREKRKLGNIGELILEWGFEQLKAAGSTERLLKYKIRPPVRHPKPRDRKSVV